MPKKLSVAFLPLERGLGNKNLDDKCKGFKARITRQRKGRDRGQQGSHEGDGRGIKVTF